MTMLSKYNVNPVHNLSGSEMKPMHKCQKLQLLKWPLEALQELVGDIMGTSIPYTVNGSNLFLMNLYGMI